MKLTKSKREDFLTRVRALGREFSAGLSRREIERLFDEDAPGAVTALAGEDDRSGDDLARLARRSIGFFLGLTLKLSPGRRLLFTAALVSAAVGVLDVEWSIGTRVVIDFSPLWFLASVAALTLLLALELVDRLRVRDELEVARELQRELLPHATPPLSGYRIAHSYRTANEIGGDYYDFLPLPDGRVALAIGDASGHGMAAGLLMAIANAAFKTALDLDPRPSKVLELLHRVLYRTGGRRAFMTLFYGLLDPATGELEYASAGHPYPLLRRVSGAVEELGEPALPLGLHGDGHFSSHRLEIAPGDFLVLYSDGLPEALGADGEAFGFERIRSLLGQPASAAELHDHILATVDRHLDDHPLTDDLTLVVVERAPALPA